MFIMGFEQIHFALLLHIFHYLFIPLFYSLHLLRLLFKYFSLSSFSPTCMCTGVGASTGWGMLFLRVASQKKTDSSSPEAISCQ